MAKKRYNIQLGIRYRNILKIIREIEGLVSEADALRFILREYEGIRKHDFKNVEGRAVDNTHE